MLGFVCSELIYVSLCELIGWHFRSLPTNIRDIPHTINTNSIRSKRRGSFASAMGEGGSTYSASTNIDNFVEERSDKMYSHGTGKSRIDLAFTKVGETY